MTSKFCYFQVQICDPACPPGCWIQYARPRRSRPGCASGSCRCRRGPPRPSAGLRSGSAASASRGVCLQRNSTARRLTRRIERVRASIAASDVDIAWYAGFELRAVTSITQQRISAAVCPYTSAARLSCMSRPCLGGFKRRPDRLELSSRAHPRHEPGDVARTVAPGLGSAIRAEDAGRRKACSRFARFTRFSSARCWAPT